MKKFCALTGKAVSHPLSIRWYEPMSSVKPRRRCVRKSALSLGTSVLDSSQPADMSICPQLVLRDGARRIPLSHWQYASLNVMHPLIQAQLLDPSSETMNRISYALNWNQSQSTTSTSKGTSSSRFSIVRRCLSHLLIRASV
jgi:hypothetical protein